MIVVQGYHWVERTSLVFVLSCRLRLLLLSPTDRALTGTSLLLAVDVVRNTDLMLKQSVWTSVISTQVAAHFMAP